jgi:anti-repressor protein
VIKDEQGNPWWVASEVCDVLGYVNSRDAIAKHCKHPKKLTVAKRDGQNGGAQFKTIINEPDLYRLIIKSRLPAAQKFEQWVMEEVLPEIRKTGGYLPTTPEMTDEEIMARAILLGQKKIQSLEHKVVEMTPKAEAFDHFISSKGLFNLTEVAKEVGIKPHKMKPFLQGIGVLQERGNGLLWGIGFP